MAHVQFLNIRHGTNARRQCRTRGKQLANRQEHAVPRVLRYGLEGLFRSNAQCSAMLQNMGRQRRGTAGDFAAMLAHETAMSPVTRPRERPGVAEGGGRKGGRDASNAVKRSSARAARKANPKAVEAEGATGSDKEWHEAAAQAGECAQSAKGYPETTPQA